MFVFVSGTTSFTLLKKGSAQGGGGGEGEERGGGKGERCFFGLKEGTGVIVYTHYQLKMSFLKALFEQTSICKKNEM